MFNWLKNLFYVEMLDTITGKEVENILLTKFGKIYTFVVDSVYSLPTRQLVLSVLEYDRTNELKYNANRDCDEFAFVLMGSINKLHPEWAFGVILAKNKNKRHALNFFISDTKEFCFVEPQNDKVFETGYTPYMVIL